MPADSLQEQIVRYLSDVHSTEENALSQETVQMAGRILAQEQAAAQKLDGLLGQAALVGLPRSTPAA